MDQFAVPHAVTVTGSNGQTFKTGELLNNGRTNIIDAIRALPDTNYTLGQVVTYAGRRYQCRQSHRSLVSWEPPNVLALWLPI